MLNVRVVGAARWEEIKKNAASTPFSRQLTIILGGTIALLAAGSSMTTSWEASRRLEHYLAQQGEQIAENCARHSVFPLLYRAAGDGADALTETLRFPDVIAADMVDADMRVVASIRKDILPDAEGKWNVRVSTRTVASELPSNAWIFEAPVYTGEERRDSPFMEDSGRQIIGYVHVAIGKGTLTKLVASIWISNILMTTMLAFGLFAALHWVTRRLMAPLRSLSGAMRRAEEGEVGVRASSDGPTDIAEMSHSFNKMIGVLEQREAELKQSRDDAVHTALVRTQFAATVSHEIRTPLNGVIGTLDMLRETELTRRQREHLELAWNSSRELSGLINDVLDFSKMDSGKVQLEEADFDLRRLIEDVIELLGTQAQKKRIDLGYVLGVGAPEWVRGDGLRLRQVLVNLVGNAIKFTHRGEVSVNVVGNTNEHGVILRFEIVDTGIGMAPDAIAHIFDKFTQADRATSKKYGGTGLGLAISRQLVMLMGGDIHVTSELGKGSVFSYMVQCKPAQRTAVPYSGYMLDGIRVLVCSQAAVVRNFVKQQFARAGLRCEIVLSLPGTIAELERAMKAHVFYDLVIIDGLEKELQQQFVRRIRDLTGTIGPRIITLDFDDELAERGGSLPDLTLQKPLRMGNLVSAIHRVHYGQSMPNIDQILDLGPVKFATEARGPAKVLIVEDDPTNRLVASGMLEMSGCICFHAMDGEEGVQSVMALQFDLILMDCHLPRMDGWEAAAHIRRFETPLGRRTPIIAMTSASSQADIEKCLSVGMDDHMSKPLTLDTFRAKVRLWLPSSSVSGTEPTFSLP